MWICLNDAFFSVIRLQGAQNAGKALVRARRRGDIAKHFGVPEEETPPPKDYRFRAIVSDDQLKAVLLKSVDAMRYTNFKGSVADHDLHDAYVKVWNAMNALQTLMAQRERPAQPGGGKRGHSRQTAPQARSLFDVPDDFDDRFPPDWA